VSNHFSRPCSEQKKVSNHFQWAETSVEPFPVELSNDFLLINLVELFPVGQQFEPFPVRCVELLQPPPWAPCRTSNICTERALHIEISNCCRQSKGSNGCAMMLQVLVICCCVTCIAPCSFWSDFLRIQADSDPLCINEENFRTEVCRALRTRY
jgi:hypothetical protein